MVAATDGMPPTRSFIEPVGIKLGYCGGRHAEVKMVHDSFRVTGLGLGAADVLFEVFEGSLDLPPGPVVFDDLLN